MEIILPQRDALHDHMLTHLSGIDDLRATYLAGDFKEAERLAVEFADDLRLMQDLGWGSPPAGNTVTLTAPPEQLRRLFTRLRDGVEGQRRNEERDEADVENEHRDAQERAKHVTEACEHVLSVVGPGPVDAEWEVD
jgi:hypothetical protein